MALKAPLLLFCCCPPEEEDKKKTFNPHSVLLELTCDAAARGLDGAVNMGLPLPQLWS